MRLSFGSIDCEFDLLDIMIHFKIPGDSESEEYYLEINICPTKIGISEKIRIGDGGVTLGRIDYASGKITDDLDFSHFYESQYQS